MKILFIFFLSFCPFIVQAHQCPDGSVPLDSVHACMSFEFTKGPFINERGQRQLSEGIAKIISFDDSLDTTRAMFYLWMKMPNMEHGGRPVTVVASRENKFKVSNILLTKMTGQWFLRVDLEPRAPHNPRTDFDGELPITQWLE